MTIMNGVYINGLDNATTNVNTTAQAGGTATADYILFSLTVPDQTGTIYYGLGNNVLASNGAVAPAAAAILAPVVTAGVTKGNCTRVWLSLGGAGSPTVSNETFSNISTILAKGGTAATNLVQNLAALATSMKALSSKITSVGFDLDNEDASPSSVVPLVAALYNHGIKQSPAVKYPFTFCAYQDDSDWFDALAGVYSALNGVQPVVGITLQVYAGGRNNNPVTWTQDLANYLQKPGSKPTGLSSAEGFILPIQSMDDTAGPVYTPGQMTSNLRRWRSTGGSFWATQALFQSPPPQRWPDYASAIASGISS
ncbi:MAG TPA: hypothetical protein VGC13_00265 [Longimicrobium sp.]|jgi:hypothetical protein|uniref:hypothetical protein n=1 Tax=Longimicrobium sp. TaxID=2029185 RepID=UPI002ED935D8